MSPNFAAFASDDIPTTAACVKHPMADMKPDIPRKPRVLVFIVAYNAEKTIHKIVLRIPVELRNTYEVDVPIIDDSSADATFEKGHAVSRDPSIPFPVVVLFNPRNQGYGGNQKHGDHYALEHGYDFVALIHGDGQYAPEYLPDLLEPLRKGEAAAVFGSRMLTPSGAPSGGMPLYKSWATRFQPGSKTNFCT